MKFPQALSTAPLILALAAGVGCTGTTTTGGTSSGSVAEDGKVISAVEITPNKDTLSKGATQQFRAVVRYADGTTEDITNSKDAVWNTSEPTVATVSRSGVVVATKEGLVNITVEYKGEKGEEHFVVMP
jgi:uncharacterized protein YjdB